MGVRTTPERPRPPTAREAAPLLGAMGVRGSSSSLSLSSFFLRFLVYFGEEAAASAAAADCSA